MNESRQCARQVAVIVASASVSYMVPYGTGLLDVRAAKREGKKQDRETQTERLLPRLTHAFTSRQSLLATDIIVGLGELL